MKNVNKQLLVTWAITIAVISLEYVFMQWSSIPDIRQFLEQPVSILILNLLILLDVNLLLGILFGKWYRALLVSALFVTIWSVCNYYTIKYHGSPLFFSEVANIPTALTVMDHYSYSLDKQVFFLLLAALVLVLLVVLLRFVNAVPGRRRSRLISFFACTSLLYVCLFRTEVFKPRNSMTWQWEVATRENGIETIMVEDVDKTINYLNVPEGYDTKYIQNIPVYENQKTDQTYPDIILILNETFYDLDDYVDIESHALKGFYGKEQAVYGKAMTPFRGGGTSNAEFELLTSNSIYALKNSSPFNFFDLSKNKNNVVQHLHSLGYTSVGMHCASKTNYSRNKAYPDLGFDDILLGPEGFTFNTYGNRNWLDQDNYNDMIQYYEKMGQGPRFLYCLTYQNHGGWEQNDPEYDTVQIKKDYGDLTDDINEYLTSVDQSVSAFNELLEYYKGVDRPVIICMLGDHAPSFINELDNDMTEEQQNIEKRAVPYIIWSNYETEDLPQSAYTSIIDLVPMILEKGGLPKTTYQQTIYDLHNEIGAITADGLVVDQNGSSQPIESSAYKEDIYKYYYMEYNALKGGKDYRKELFEKEE